MGLIEDQFSSEVQFNATGSLKIAGIDELPFITYSDENLVGQHYGSIEVLASVSGESHYFPGLIGRAVQVVCYPMDYSYASATGMVKVPHQARFDTLTGELEIIRPASDISLICDTAIILFAKGEDTAVTDSYGMKISNSDGVSVVDSSYKNLVLSEYMSHSVDDIPGFFGDYQTISLANATFRLYDLPEYSMVRNRIQYVFFKQSYGSPPLVAIGCKSEWVFLGFLNSASDGAYFGFAILVPDGFGSSTAGDDLEVAIFSPTSNNERISYEVDSYESSYPLDDGGFSAAKSVTRIYASNDYDQLPVVTIRNSNGDILLNTRNIPCPNLCDFNGYYASIPAPPPSTAVGSSVIPADMVDASPPSYIISPLLVLTKKHLLVAGMNISHYISESSSWRESHCNFLGCFSHTDYVSQGYVLSVVTSSNDPDSGANIVTKYRAYYLTGRWESSFGTLLTDALSGLLSGISELLSGDISGLATAYNSLFGSDGGSSNYTNTDATGLPNAFMLPVYLPTYKIDGIVSQTVEVTGQYIPDVEIPSSGNEALTPEEWSPLPLDDTFLHGGIIAENVWLMTMVDHTDTSTFSTTEDFLDYHGLSYTGEFNSLPIQQRVVMIAEFALSIGQSSAHYTILPYGGDYTYYHTDVIIPLDGYFYETFVNDVGVSGDYFMGWAKWDHLVTHHVAETDRFTGGQWVIYSDYSSMESVLSNVLSSVANPGSLSAEDYYNSLSVSEKRNLYRLMLTYMLGDSQYAVFCRTHEYNITGTIGNYSISSGVLERVQAIPQSCTSCEEKSYSSKSYVEIPNCVPTCTRGTYIPPEEVGSVSTEFYIPGDA